MLTNQLCWCNSINYRKVFLLFSLVFIVPLMMVIMEMPENGIEQKKQEQDEILIKNIDQKTILVGNFTFCSFFSVFWLFFPFKLNIIFNSHEIEIHLMRAVQPETIRFCLHSSTVQSNKILYISTVINSVIHQIVFLSSM